MNLKPKTMCLITDRLEKQIATKNITVFKVMKKNLKSYFQEFQYELGVLNETEIQEVENEYDWCACCSLDWGYLAKKYDVTTVCSLVDNPLIKAFDRGFHTVKNFKDCFRVVCDDDEEIESEYYNNLHIFECEIPKGSEYYTDGVDFHISNKLIITKDLGSFGKLYKK